jgi:hypothetical protein
MQMAGHSNVLIAMIDVDSGDDEDFNRWYIEDHIPERLSCPGFISARWFKISEGTLPRYLVIFELAGPEALQTPEYLALAGREDTKRWAARFTRIMRSVYTEQLELH